MEVGYCAPRLAHALIHRTAALTLPLSGVLRSGKSPRVISPDLARWTRAGSDKKGTEGVHYVPRGKDSYRLTTIPFFVGKDAKAQAQTLAGPDTFEKETNILSPDVDDIGMPPLRELSINCLLQRSKPSYICTLVVCALDLARA